MAESAIIRGMKSLELNDSDAAVRKTRFSHISVKGYDTWLQKYAIELTLRKCFASCGKILAVSFLKSVALMRFEEEDAIDKALQLSGTDVGGWTAIVKPVNVKAAPRQSKPFDFSAPRIKQCRVLAKGYDTGLPEIDIEIALCKHFSSCGEVKDVIVLSSSDGALLIIEGEGCEEKALDLSGRQVGGMNLEVQPPMPRPDSPGGRKKITVKAYGYTLPSLKLELAKKKIEKNKKKKERKKKKKMEKKEMEMALS